MELGEYSGRIIDGRYELLVPLGKGGMGEVYLARHKTVGREVAVKVLRSIFQGNESLVARFYREAQAAASIKHRNIIDVIDVGTASWGDPFIVMEYLKGESLGDLLARRDTLSLSAACAVMEPALLALTAAHESGVIHRDLKPDNIFLVDVPGEVPEIKLIDFGISKITAGDQGQRLTQEGSLLGTPSYMSPEQARGQREVDGRADLYSMGVILYEMLTRTLPFEGENYNAILIASLTEQPKSPYEANPDFPSEAEPIVMKALQKKPEDRYQDAGEMLEAIAELKSFLGRNEALAQAAEGMAKPTFAIGDLGMATTTINLDSAGLDKLLRNAKKTPGAWAGTGGETSITGPKAKTALGLSAVLLLLAVAAFGILYGTGFWSGEKGDSSSRKVLPAATLVPVGGDGVSITVQGVPSQAKIYYDDVMVPMNPFRVEKKSTIVTLRVDADGFEPYRIAVEPSKDRVIHVELVAVNPRKNPRPTKTAPTPVPKPAPEPNPDPETENGLGSPLKFLKKKIDQVYHSRKGELVECYNASLAKGEAPADSPVPVKLHLKIRPSGVVESVTVGGAGEYPELSDCLTKFAGAWVFPPSPEGRTETFPIQFTTKK